MVVRLARTIKQIIRVIALFCSALFSMLLLVLLASALGYEPIDINLSRHAVAKWLTENSSWHFEINDALHYDWRRPGTVQLQGLVVEGPHLRIEIAAASARVSLPTLLGLQLRVLDLKAYDVQVIPSTNPYQPQPQANRGMSLGALRIDDIEFNRLSVDISIAKRPIKFSSQQVLGEQLSFDEAATRIGQWQGDLQNLDSRLDSRLGALPLKLKQGRFLLAGYHNPKNHTPSQLEQLQLEVEQLAIGRGKLSQAVLHGSIRDRTLLLTDAQIHGLELDYSRWFQESPDTKPLPNPRRQQQRGDPLSWLEHVRAPAISVNLDRFFNSENPFAMEATALQLALNDFHLPLSDPTATHAQGTWQAKQLQQVPYQVAQPTGTISFDQHLMNISLLQGAVFGGTFEGRLATDLQKGNTQWQLHVVDVNSQQLDENFSLVPGTPLGKLSVRAAGTITTEPAVRNETQFAITSQDLTVTSLNLDAAIDGLLAMKHIDLRLLADVPLFLLLGPFAMITLHGIDLGVAMNILHKARTGQTHFQQAYLQGRITDQVILFNDFALATKRYRVAVRGALDQANQRYNSLIVAVLNPAGCARLELLVSGPFAEPDYKLQRLKTPQNCQPFYLGPVAHPRN